MVPPRRVRGYPHPLPGEHLGSAKDSYEEEGGAANGRTAGEKHPAPLEGRPPNRGAPGGEGDPTKRDSPVSR